MIPRIVILVAVFCLLTAPVGADNLLTVIVSDGNQNETRGFNVPWICSGNAWKLVEKVIDAYVVKSYFFIASDASAVDAWLISDTNQIVGEVHRIVANNPRDPAMHYWEAERTFGRLPRLEPDGVWVHKLWVMSICWDGSYIQPYAIVWTRMTP